MASTEQQVSAPKQEYLTKKVMVNGQFVTLYSLNGQTWLSSPEEIPEVMARLDNSRITLTEAGKDGTAAPVPEAAKPAERPAPVVPSPVAPPTTLASKYRMKGPKPRPILRQNGMSIKGTPVEPFSASEVQVSPQQKAPAKAANPKEARAKLKAPLRAERGATVPAKGASSMPKGKKISAPTAAAKAPVKVGKEAKLPQAKVASKPVRVPAAQAKTTPALKVLKGALKKGPVVKKSQSPKGKAKPAAGLKKAKKPSKR